jgi:outer membrane protein TolC
MSNGNQFLPVRDEIARRAYELYVARGEQNGSDVDDWLTAEREVQSNCQDGLAI